jgi:hypothetical protein
MGRSYPRVAAAHHPDVANSVVPPRADSAAKRVTVPDRDRRPLPATDKTAAILTHPGLPPTQNTSYRCDRPRDDAATCRGMSSSDASTWPSPASRWSSSQTTSGTSLRPSQVLSLVLCDRPLVAGSALAQHLCERARYVTNQTEQTENRTTDSKDSRATIHFSQPDRR